MKIAKDHTYLEIGSELGIAPSTACRIFQLFMQTGGVEPKGNKGPRMLQRKLDDNHCIFLIGLVLEAPFLYLSELCKKVREVSGIDVCLATICTVIHRQWIYQKDY